jgi:hypothetical protein
MHAGDDGDILGSLIGIRFSCAGVLLCSKLALEEGMAWRERVGMARLARDLLRVRTAHALHRRVGCIELAAVVGIVAQERNGD